MACLVSFIAVAVLLALIATSDGATVPKKCFACKLQKIVMQQSATIQRLENDVAALKTAVQSLGGSKTAPVAFSVRFAADNIYSGLPIGPGQILRFDDVVTNTGNGYDRQTGLFTAPVSGSYAFFLNVMGVGRSGLLGIEKTGRALTYVYSKASADNLDQGATMVTSYLNAGESVWVRQHSLDAVRGTWFTIFTGFLIQAQ